MTRPSIGLALVVAAACAAPHGPETIQPNDNRQAAGTLKDGVLTMALETRMGRWQPDGDGGQFIDSLAAFAEVGHPLSTPGPLLRVPIGTTIRGTFHNTLHRQLTMFGLGKTRGFSDSVLVPAGATTAFDFEANHAGTFYYYARSGIDSVLGFRPQDEEQLQGAIIIDTPDSAPDRIIGLSWYFEINPESPSGFRRGTMALNGRAWPHTERLSYTQDDSVRWRVINFTGMDHPMHLHGFYFRVNGVSDGVTDTLYKEDQQRMAVTEMVNPFQGVELAWKADRSGNWAFHCHYATHINSAVELDTWDGTLDPKAEEHHPSDRPHHMSGLVMGITVAPKGPELASAEPNRKIRIEQREKPGVYGEQAGLSYTMRDTRGSDPDAMPVPGPILVLERGKRVEVTIVNQSNSPAAVHWHGIELESYPDGIPGWSGSGKQLFPVISPRDSLSVRWTPPRAGSFMYHSHIHEAQQMGSGLYGPIIVLEPGEKFDPEADRLFFFGTAGTQVNFLGSPPEVLLNGATHPGPMRLTAGRRYRFRFFNLAGDGPTQVSLTRDGKPVEWRAVAKDGYPLPNAQAVRKPATLLFDPGEIYDYEFIAEKSGDLTLTFGWLPPPPPPPGAPAGPPVPPPVAVAVQVR